jgi:hypothetical protein
MRFGIPVIGQDLRGWGEELRRFLARTWDNLSFKSSDASPATDGIILWDASSGYPVVSKNGEWRQVVLGDGHAIFAQDATITAAASNTAYAIEFDAPSLADGITKSGTNPTRIVFSEGGLYRVSFTAQIASSSASTLEFRFWPRVNGTNITGSTMVATTSTSGSLLAHAATAYAPASPSATMAISRVQA